MAGRIDADMLSMQLMEVGNEVMHLRGDVARILSRIDEAEERMRLEDEMAHEPLDQERIRMINGRIFRFRKDLISVIMQGFLQSRGMRELGDEELSILSSQLMYAMDGNVHIPGDDIPF